MVAGNGKSGDMDPGIVYVDTTKTIQGVLQELWSLAAGNDGYDKRAWADLQYRIQALITAVDMDHDHGHGWCREDIQICLLCRALRVAYGEE